MTDNMQDLCIEYDQPIIEALKKLDINTKGVVFVVRDGIFVGTASDGDIRRAFIKGTQKEDIIGSICNKNATRLHVDTDNSKIQNLLSNAIKIIPLLNDFGRVVDYASIMRIRRIPVMEPLLGGNELEYITDCIKSNWISSQGKYVTQFENMLAKYCDVGNCLAVSNGTTAIHLALVSLGIGHGDEVIVPDLTFGASVNSILHAGAMPVLVDIDHGTWNISPEKIRGAITRQTKAIMPVHIYGNPCDMEAILEIAREFDLFIIEDCAEALGSTINGQPVGSFGDASCFSFFGNKVITCGEGGAVMFRDEETHKRALIRRDHGMRKDRRYWHDVIGYNYRLTNMQAAIGCAQLEQIDTFRNKRKEIFYFYDQYLLPSGYFEKQTIHPSGEGSYWLYTLCLNNNVNINRDQLIEELLNSGVDTRPLFYPMHEMPAFKEVKMPTDYDTSRDISYRGISLPSSVTLTEEDIKKVSTNLLTAIDNLAS